MVDLPAVMEMNEAIERALAVMEDSNRSLLLTGKAGTGKSTLLRWFRVRTGKKLAVLAPTGVAALNVEGETIHSFFGFGPDITVEKASEMKTRRGALYAHLQAIVLDEVSMVRADLLDCIDAFLKRHGPVPTTPFGGVQMILIGDLYQLPPVVTSEDRAAFRSTYKSPYFFDANCFSELDLEYVELEKVYRQKDAHFVQVLNAIRNNTAGQDALGIINARVDPEHDPKPEELVVCLTPTNAAADLINARRLEALPGEAEWFDGASTGAFEERGYPAPRTLAIKPGAQVMMVSNDAEGRWVNGSLGRVLHLKAQESAEPLIVVRLTDGEDVEVGKKQWDLFKYVWDRKLKRLDTESAGSYTQYPLRLAWAVTIHKSQGKTFERVILDLGRGAFATGQVYVALSRVTSLEGLTLTRPLRRNEIFVDRRIVRFVTGFQYAKADKLQSLDDKLELIKAAIRNRQALLVTYLKASDERSARTITPEEVGEMSHAGRTFIGVRGHCHLRRESRTFRLDRILTLQPA